MFLRRSYESFPRMWDQQDFMQLRGREERIIPTYVGSTQYPPWSACRISNHSHVCGINAYGNENLGYVVESFPRMWDQRCFRLLRPPALRIIPTYVGSTRNYTGNSKKTPNHSHVCGINMAGMKLFPDKYESFPRMWDQQQPYQWSYVVRRIIPTYVGSTETS